jgi:hypothetical protein
MRLRLLVCVVFLTSCCAAQSQTASDPCAEAVRAAYEKGLIEGYKLGSQSGVENAATVLRKAGTKFSVVLSVENLEEADSYKFAAAEVLRNHFSDLFAVEPVSPAGAFDQSVPLVLHIAGVGDYAAEMLTVELAIPLQHGFRGQDLRYYTGWFVLADTSALARGGTLDQRTERVKEAVFKVITEFQEKWKATKQYSPGSGG